MTAGSLLVWVFARWQAVDHAPWSNMYEFSTAFATAITMFYVIFDRVYGRDERGRPARALGALVMPLVLAILLLTAAFFPSEIHPLVPALQNSDLLAIHVASMIVAYGALSVSFAAAVLYLAQGGPRNRFRRLPDAKTLDDIAYRSVMVGFPVLALGHRSRGLLGGPRLGPLLGLGPERDVRAGDLAYLWRLPAHAWHSRMVGHAFCLGPGGRVRRRDVHLLRGEPVGERAAQLRGSVTHESRSQRSEDLL